MQRERLIETELPHSGVNAPHFDEDWTILSARPVVALDDLKGGRSQNILKILAAFAGAGLLGVFVALASIRLRDTNNAQNEQAVLPTQNQSVESQNQSVESQDPTVEPATNQDGIVEVAPVTEPSPLPTKTQTRVIESEKRQITQNVTPPSNTENETAEPAAKADPPPDQSGAQLVDEWQERRPRRIRTRRPRREFDDLHHRDLLKIEEIFEGRRPRN